MGITMGTCFVGRSAAGYFVVQADDKQDIGSMEKLSGREVLEAVSGLLRRGGREVDFKRVCTDSRSALPGDLFFAIKGEKFDGHDFIGGALARGAAGIVFQRGKPLPQCPRDVCAIEVDDTRVALGELASYYRRRLMAKVVAVVGSVGKTTTKAMTAHLLGACANVTASPKSYNNAIGVPLTLFQLDAGHQYAVVEMGANAPGEIRRLAEIARPDAAIVTAIAPVHVEGLGGLEGIAREKGDVASFMAPDGCLFVNGDDPWCLKIAERYGGRVVTFGAGQSCDVRASDVKRTEQGLRFVLDDEHEIVLDRVRGVHNVSNALAAIAVYLHFGFDPDLVAERFSGFRLPSMRLELLPVGRRQCILDCYNANIRSMAAGLDELALASASRPAVAVLGDMAELGELAEPCHRDLGKMVAQRGIDVLVAIGPQMMRAADAAIAAGMAADRVFRFDSAADARERIDAILPDNAVFLLKGSRCMGLEVLFEHLRSWAS